MSNGNDYIPTVSARKELEEAALSFQARAESGQEMQAGLFWLLASTGGIVSPWWSKRRDMDLREFWRKCDHFSGAVYSIAAKLASVPFRIEPRDPAVKTHWAQAEEYQMALEERSDFGHGWISLIGKSLQDLWTQDNGMFWEIIGAGDPAGPIKGPAVGVAYLDASRCTRTGDPEYPVIFEDTDSKRYRLHYTRVGHYTQLPSPSVEMNGVGTCWLSRCISIAQNFADILQYQQEKLGSRPLRGIIYGGGAKGNLISEAVEAANEAADNAGQARFSRFPVVMNEYGEMTLDVLDLASLPDGFDYQTSITLGMYAIALAGGFPPRWLWPASVTGATKADAMYQHLAGAMSGAGQTLTAIRTILGGSVRGKRHSMGKFLPSHLRMVFDFQDDMADQMSAEIRALRSERHERDVAVELITIRVAREQMLADGDLTESQFEDLELADGRLPDGSDVLDLFYMGIDLLRGIDVDDPDLATVEERLKKAKEQSVTARTPGQRKEAKQAVAALQKLLEGDEPEEAEPVALTTEEEEMNGQPMPPRRPEEDALEEAAKSYLAKAIGPREYAEFVAEMEAIGAG